MEYKISFMTVESNTDSINRIIREVMFVTKSSILWSEIVRWKAIAREMWNKSESKRKA